jgi:hypothetical protein
MYGLDLIHTCADLYLPPTLYTLSALEPNRQYDETRTVPGAMREWMKGQADAALAADIPVMWCMERASEMVQAVEFPAVTTARASGDYHPPSANWQIGPGESTAPSVAMS